MSFLKEVNSPQSSPLDLSLKPAVKNDKEVEENVENIYPTCSTSDGNVPSTSAMGIDSVRNKDYYEEEDMATLLDKLAVDTDITYKKVESIPSETEQMDSDEELDISTDKLIHSRDDFNDVSPISSSDASFDEFYDAASNSTVGSDDYHSGRSSPILAMSPSLSLISSPNSPYKNTSSPSRQTLRNLRLAQRRIWKNPIFFLLDDITDCEEPDESREEESLSEAAIQEESSSIIYSQNEQLNEIVELNFSENDADDELESSIAQC